MGVEGLVGARVWGMSWTLRNRLGPSWTRWVAMKVDDRIIESDGFLPGSR